MLFVPLFCTPLARQLANDQRRCRKYRTATQCNVMCYHRSFTPNRPFMLSVFCCFWPCSLQTTTPDPSQKIKWKIQCLLLIRQYVNLPPHKTTAQPIFLSNRYCQMCTCALRLLTFSVQNKQFLSWVRFSKHNSTCKVFHSQNQQTFVRFCCNRLATTYVHTMKQSMGKREGVPQQTNSVVTRDLARNIMIIGKWY